MASLVHLRIDLHLLLDRLALSTHWACIIRAQLPARVRNTRALLSSATRQGRPLTS